MKQNLRLFHIKTSKLSPKPCVALHFPLSLSSHSLVTSLKCWKIRLYTSLFLTTPKPGLRCLGLQTTALSTLTTVLLYMQPAGCLCQRRPPLLLKCRPLSAAGTPHSPDFSCLSGLPTGASAPRCAVSGDSSLSTRFPCAISATTPLISITVYYADEL